MVAGQGLRAKRQRSEGRCPLSVVSCQWASEPVGTATFHFEFRGCVGQRIPSKGRPMRKMMEPFDEKETEPAAEFVGSGQ